MNFTYLILANLYISCWLGFYYLFCSRKITFRLNRSILLSGFAIAVILPLAVIPDFLPAASPAHTIVAASFPQAVVLMQPASPEITSFPFWEILLTVYWTGFAISLFLFIIKLFKLNHYIRKFPHISYRHYVHVVTPEHWEVFSFMHYMFAPRTVSQSVLEHEKVHIRQRHSIDNLLSEIFRIFCWFNPLIFIYQKTIKMNHEYLADASTIKIVEIKEYAQKLVSQSFRLSELSLVHPFFNRSHLQKRLIMLRKNNKSKKGGWMYLLLLPALAGVLFLTSSFSVKERLNKGIAYIKPVKQNSHASLSLSQRDGGIEGSIHSPSNDPVAGANIIVGNTRHGTISDDNGHFRLARVTAGTILHISRIGYNSITLQVPDKKKKLDIVLYPKPTSLHKVNVTAYVNKPLNKNTKSSKGAKPDTSISRVFQFVEQMPSFPGGQSALMKYLGEHIKYPKTAKDAGAEGTVVVTFVINKDGSITGVKTVGKELGSGLEEESIRIVKGMPDWIPGKQNGKKARVQFSLPIRYKLSGSNDTLPPPPPPPNRKGKVQHVAGQPYTFVEQMPSFPGGQSELMKYLSEHIKYPKNARENGIKGTILVQFIVEKDGTITKVHTIGQKKGGGLEEEAMRVVKSMPKWIPGKQDGKVVNVKYSLPIRFRLQ